MTRQNHHRYLFGQLESSYDLSNSSPDQHCKYGNLMLTRCNHSDKTLPGPKMLSQRSVGSDKGYTRQKGHGSSDPIFNFKPTPGQHKECVVADFTSSLRQHLSHLSPSRINGFGRAAMYLAIALQITAEISNDDAAFFHVRIPSKFVTLRSVRQALPLTMILTANLPARHVTPRA